MLRALEISTRSYIQRDAQKFTNLKGYFLACANVCCSFFYEMQEIVSHASQGCNRHNFVTG